MNKKYLWLLIPLAIILVAVFILLFKLAWEVGKSDGVNVTPFLKSPSTNAEPVKKFSSKEDFVAYLKKSEEKAGSFGAIRSLGGGVLEERMMTSLPGGEGFSALSALSGNLAVPERISETNVQVLGIDEPDIVKTDGKNIYFSSEGSPIVYGGPMPLMEERQAASSEIHPVPPPDYEKPKTKIINAFPPAGLEKVGDIEKNGELLLLKDKKILVIFSGREITGYDVSDPKNPKEKWNLKLADKTTLAGSRLYQDSIYIVTQNYIDQSNPCPVKPLTIGTEELTIACQEIYHPARIIPADVDFSVMSLNPASGKIKDKTSFIGSSSGSNIYMSENAVYVTYSFTNDIFGYLVSAINEKGKDILPSYVIDNLNKTKNYDISDEAKMTEFQKTLEDYTKTLSNDDELRIQNEMQNRLGDYFKEHSRDLEKTGIVKIDIGGLSITASGNVPGRPLNQFSLDEYQGNLRIATTIGGGFWGWGFGGSEANVNDVYVLDKKLEITGSIKGLGITERIYSARFLGNRGYLVTFRQTDPFYVLDLTDPKKPEMKGELKIPGFSSYLHPLADDIILGVGQESGKVKLSLFDVISASDPKEIDKYLLDEYWSEAQSNHHAFLQDAKHGIFFIPGGKGGYIFSYEGNKLSLKKAVSDYQVKRAVYIDDYLYIIGENKISVLDEKNWEKVKELDL